MDYSIRRSDFRGGLRKRLYFEKECVVAIQGHPRVGR